MHAKNLPVTYKGYLTEELLKTWEEIRSPEGTRAPREVIAAMNELLREYDLGLFGVLEKNKK